MNMLAGMDVVVIHNWPVDVIGTSIRPLYGPKWFAWFLRLVGIDPFVCWVPLGPITQERPPMALAGRLHCSPRQYQALRSQVTAMNLDPIARINLGYPR